MNSESVAGGTKEIAASANEAGEYRPQSGQLATPRGGANTIRELKVTQGDGSRSAASDPGRPGPATCTTMYCRPSCW